MTPTVATIYAMETVPPVINDVYDFNHCKTRDDRFGPYFKPDVIAAILAAQGNFTEMAVLLGRRRNGVRDYVLAHLDVKDIYDEMRECFLDQVEKNHNDLASKDQDGAALRFILQTQGKDRGYSTRVEQTGKDGGPMQVLTLDVTKLTIEELRAIKNATTKKGDADSQNGSAADHTG